MCALFPVLTKDPFELAYDVRSEIHKYLDIALYVVICDEPAFRARGQEQWTIEHAIMVEGVPVWSLKGATLHWIEYAEHDLLTVEIEA